MHKIKNIVLYRDALLKKYQSQSGRKMPGSAVNAGHVAGRKYLFHRMEK